MSVIEKLKEAVRSVVQERQDLYAEARLNDGRVIATEAEQFSAGASVRVLSEDGEAAPLEAGTYELSDGGEVTVDAESNVVEMNEEEEKTEAAEHEEEKDEMAAVKAALVDHFQISEEVAEQIVEVVKDAMKPVEAAEHEDKEEEMEEEEKKEEMSEEKTEMSSHVQDLTHEMAVALEAINKRLEKLEEAPAAQPDRVLPKQEFNAVPKTDSRSSSFDNAYNIINSFK
jgi:hypothetical protein